MTQEQNQYTCKDCIYFKVCFVNGICDSAGAMCDGDDQLWTVCGYFSEKSEWLHLPCKVGDRVFSIVIIGGEYTIVADRANGFITCGETINIITSWYLDGGEWCENIFPTQETAEKALAERRKSK